MSPSGRFSLLILESKPVFDVAEMWTDALFRQILLQVGYDAVDDIDPADVREMTVMVLQDLAPEEAAEALLAVLAAGLSSGQRRNLAQEMKGQRMWEEYANPAFHAPIFAATALLHEAFPRVYLRPDIARLVLQLSAGNGAAAQALPAPTPALAVRLLAAGLDENSLLRRLYGAALDSDHFPEAASIIWLAHARSGTAETAEWLLYGSWVWLRPLRAGQRFDATLHQKRS